MHKSKSMSLLLHNTISAAAAAAATEFVEV
jgi:hypothetical protein